MWDKSLTDVFLLGKVVCKGKLLADVVEVLEGTGQKKHLKADWEPCFCTIWCDKQTFSLAIS